MKGLIINIFYVLISLQLVGQIPPTEYLEGYVPYGYDTYEYRTPNTFLPFTPSEEVSNYPWEPTSQFPLVRLKYKNGLLDGTFIYYWENGNIQFEITIKEGLVQGVNRQYYESGVLFIEAEMKQTSLLETTSSESKGKISTYITPSGSTIHSERYYDKNPSNPNIRELVITEESISPPYHGSFNCYWPNGNLMEKSSYINGRKTGYAFYYNEDGTLLAFDFNSLLMG